MSIKLDFPRSFFAAALFFFAVIAFHEETAAQTKQKFPLTAARGEAGKAVAGRVRGSLNGTTYRDYFFYIPTGRSIDISLATDSGEQVIYDVISPKGKTIFQKETEILDELPSKGTYTIRVYRNKEATDKNGTSKYQLAIFMYI